MGLVEELVSTRRLPRPSNMSGVNVAAVISRALTSFLQHVGIIKAEFLDKNEDEDTLFQEKFRQLLERYMKLTSKGMFTKATPVSFPTVSCSNIFPQLLTVILQ